jgi:hypothetical protein
MLRASSRFIRRRFFVFLRRSFRQRSLSGDATYVDVQLETRSYRRHKLDRAAAARAPLSQPRIGTQRRQGPHAVEEQTRKAID